MVKLTELSNFWSTIEILQINCEINFILSWSKNCVIAASNAVNQATFFAITDINMFVL